MRKRKAATPPVSETPEWQRDLIAGLAIFFSMSYVVFAIPAMMAKAGLPAGPIFIGTCIAAAAASLAAGLYGRTPTAIAPGLALSATLSPFLVAGGNNIPWQSAFVICFAAGLFLFFLSVTQLRIRIVDAIPPVIKLAVTGGIGAVLADSARNMVSIPDDIRKSVMNELSAQNPTLAFDALDKLAKPALDRITNDRILLFLFGIAFITVGYFVLLNLASRYRDRSYARWLDVSGRASLALSVPLVALMAHWLGVVGTQTLQAEGIWLWSPWPTDWRPIFAAVFSPPGYILFAFVLYILLVDIVGSPYQMESEKLGYIASRRSAKANKTIHRSFIVDSLANVAAPALGTPPTVYYAENYAGKVLGAKGGLAAIIPAIGFIGWLALFLWLGTATFRNWIPDISVAPVLFFVGLMLIAQALNLSAAQSNRNASQSAKSGELGVTGLERHLPAGIAIVVTPIPGAGFEIGVAAGVLAYYLLFVLVPASKDSSLAKSERNSLGVFAVLALFAIGLKIYVVFS